MRKLGAKMVRLMSGVMVLFLLISLSSCCAPPPGARAEIAPKDLEIVRGKCGELIEGKGEGAVIGDCKVVGDERADLKIKEKPVAPKKQKTLNKKLKKSPEKKKLAALIPKTKLPDETSKLRLLRQVKNIDSPQAIAFDQKRLRFYISRLGTAQNPGEGSIGLLARDGSLINANWIKGLKQPRGLVVRGDYLYVADGPSLVEIEIASERITNRFEVQGGFYLNDVALANDATIYVTEPLRNALYRLDKNGTFDRFIQDDKLDGPNSLSVVGKTIYVGSHGMIKDKSSSISGGLFKIDIATKSIKKISKGSHGPISGLAINGNGRIFAAAAQDSDLLTFDLKSGKLLSRRAVNEIAQLTSPHALGDFLYFKGAKEFWMPIKSNGLILVFVEGDASLSFDEGEAR